MKLIIAGSRKLNITPYMIEEIRQMFGLRPSEIVCGAAPGVDSAGHRWAMEFERACSMFPAEWERYGKMAGPRRNKQMAEYGDALLLIWDGKSAGSANMKMEMRTLGKPIYEIVVAVANDPDTSSVLLGDNSEKATRESDVQRARDAYSEAKMRGVSRGRKTKLD